MVICHQRATHYLIVECFGHLRGYSIFSKRYFHEFLFCIFWLILIFRALCVAAPSLSLVPDFYSLFETRYILLFMLLWINLKRKIIIQHQYTICILGYYILLLNILFYLRCSYATQLFTTTMTTIIYAHVYK